jgi:hypothetical protein
MFRLRPGKIILGDKWEIIGNVRTVKNITKVGNINAQILNAKQIRNQVAIGNVVGANTIMMTISSSAKIAVEIEIKVNSSIGGPCQLQRKH